MSYKTVKKDAFAETEIKKSKFLAHIAEVKSEEEAEALIKQTTETRLTKSAIKTIQILPAHLVHDHTHD